MTMLRRGVTAAHSAATANAVSCSLREASNRRAYPRFASSTSGFRIPASTAAAAASPTLSSSAAIPTAPVPTSRVRVKVPTRRAHVLSTPLVHQAAWISSSPRYSNQSAAAARDRYEQKYADRLKAKAKESGLDDVEQLRAKSRLEYKVKQRLGNRLPAEVRELDRLEKLAGRQQQEQQQQNTPPSASSGAAGDAKQNATATKARASESSASQKDKSPVKPLGDIVDLPKMLELPVASLNEVWNGYHQLGQNVVSAVIPYELYQTMESIARRYPQFVVPLPREVLTEGDERSIGAEIHFLQWAFLPGSSASAVNSLPDGSAMHTSTVLYTPLAQYQAHQAFAQPHLILTHYLDLVPSHGVVLMRGDLTDSVSTKITDAQLLVLRLQQFYQNKHEGRAALLRQFHEEPHNFDIARLVDIVGEV